MEKPPQVPSQQVSHRAQPGLHDFKHNEHIKNDCTMHTIVYKTDKQHALLYSTGNYIHYPVINHNGKEYEKEDIYMYN